ncbi:hypothetical protein ACFL0W_05970 [Nanoarchaeota archaeon]
MPEEYHDEGRYHHDHRDHPRGGPRDIGVICSVATHHDTPTFGMPVLIETARLQIDGINGREPYKVGVAYHSVPITQPGTGVTTEQIIAQVLGTPNRIFRGYTPLGSIEPSDYEALLAAVRKKNEKTSAMSIAPGPLNVGSIMEPLE